MVFSNDGRLLAAAQPGILRKGPQSIAVLEVMTGRLLARIPASLGYCRALAFTPDNRLLVAIGADALHIWQWLTGERVGHIPAKKRLTNWTPQRFARSLSVSPDGKVLATGHDNGRILLWDLDFYHQRVKGFKGHVDTKQCWLDLGREGRVAYEAIEKLTYSPKSALQWLRRKLTPEQIDQVWLARQLKALDSTSFKDRERASLELTKVAELIEEELKRVLDRTSSPEAIRRLRKLLRFSRLTSPGSESLRRLRAVVVLERIGSKEALAFLQRLATGAPRSRLTREAKAAVARLKRPPSSSRQLLK